MPVSMLRVSLNTPVVRSIAAVVVIAVVGACETPDGSRPAPATDTVGASEQNDIIVLFDGESLDAWRGFQRSDIPEGWTITDDGELHFTSAEGDINQGLITKETFSDFDLRFEWRIASGGNSGVFFHVTEEEDTIWKTGPEYQLVDNADHADGANPKTAAAANYGLHGPDQDYARPAGEYNEGRIVVHDGHVEHYLNGHMVVEYELGSEEWTALVAESPFEAHSHYGRTNGGHIALQEGGPVWFRNITIQQLSDDGSHADGHAHAHAAEGEGEMLLPIMQKLGSDMLSITHALMTDDDVRVAASAAAIADHVPIASSELERIQNVLGDEMAEFERLDEEVHMASMRLHEAAEDGRTEEVLRLLNEVQQGCISCHAQFRERLRTNPAP